MDQVRECKQLFAQGTSIRQIARKTGFSRNTVRRYVRCQATPGVYTMVSARAQPARTKLGVRVVSILEEEKRSCAPKKQRLTAARIGRMLEDEGLEVSPRTVQGLVRDVRFEQRDALKQAYLPLAYEPGEDAQVDFFEAVVDDVDAGRIKVFVLLVRACFSRRCYAYVAPNQTREALFEGLMQALEFFGGVFLNLWFDNLTPAVRKVLCGRNRVQQKAFADFAAHYGFTAQFCSPGKGNEKGGVEGEVRYSRHEVLTPIPTVRGRKEVQKLFDAWMVKDVERTIRGVDCRIGEAWELEVPELLALPPARFEAACSRVAKVTNRSWVQTGTNYYSVPVDWVAREVVVRIDAERVRIVGPAGVQVEHDRRYGRNEMSLVLDHYLPLLERKHRGVDRALPVRQFLKSADPIWKALLAELRRTLGEIDGAKDFVAVLCLCPKYGRDRVQAAVEKSMRQECISLESVRHQLWTTIEQKSPAPAPIAYPGPAVLQGSIAAYGCLQQNGVRAHV